ncbi:MAG: carboxymethylenebutenolidase, partial [Saprospiraceae bacterium]
MAMKEIKKEDINQEVFDLYDEYAHNKIDRRTFMDKLAAYAIGGITISTLLGCVMPNY